jgi:hypothetical protein
VRAQQKKAQANRHEQKFVEVQEQFEERQRTREALIGMLSSPYIKSLWSLRLFSHMCLLIDQPRWTVNSKT